MMRIGLLSFAHVHAEGYVRALQAMPDVELVGAADDNMARGQHFAEQFGIRLFDSYAALLAAGIDGVIVCSENSRHRELVELAAARGVAVLCEKPLATTVADAQRMVDVCAQANVPLMTAFPMRFSPPVIEIKKLIPALGAIYGINSTNQGSLPEFHQAENLAFLGRNWFADPQLAGGGALIDHTVHLADLFRWLFDAEVAEVYAQTNTIIGRDKTSVDTGGLVMLTFRNGMFASIDCSWSKPAAYPTWGGLALDIIGTNGVATADAFKQRIAVYAHKPRWAFWGSDANAGMIRDFLDAVRDQRAPTVTGVDGLRATEIVAAAYQSAKTGEPVKI